MGLAGARRYVDAATEIGLDESAVQELKYPKVQHRLLPRDARKEFLVHQLGEQAKRVLRRKLFGGA
jgi:hypothetical protein